MPLFRRQPLPEASPGSPWRRTTDATDWVAIDLETTGLHARTNRVVEIGLVRFDSRGRELDAWTTLLDPGRDLGPTSIHGITARDVRGAPTFGDVLPELLARTGGARWAAHNAVFEVSFLSAELSRLGIALDGAEAFCTMTLPYRLGIVRGRGLSDCCADLGIPLERHHAALDDARAAGGILFKTLHRMADQETLPAVAPGWPSASSPVALRPRGTKRPLVDSRLGSLASRIGVPDGLASSEEASLSYLALLDQVLEDRTVTDDEVRALEALALDLGISPETATSIHRSYLREVDALARADGVVTFAERADLDRLVELLGVDLEGDAAPGPEVNLPARAASLAGRAVCFTGESVCSMGGVQLSRARQEQLAKSAGLVVKSNVSAKLDVLVLADPDSMSGKARQARALGVRCMAEPVFWRALGVAID